MCVCVCVFHLEANLHVLTELRAAAQFTVQTLVNEAVELVGAVAAVVLMVTQQRLVHTLPVPACVQRLVTSFLCFQAENTKHFT